MSATAHAARLRLRMLLEGIEVPLIAANIQVAPNSPMVATLQMPPLAEGTRLLPRTLVHVFFWDWTAPYSQAAVGRSASNVDPGVGDPTANESEEDAAVLGDAQNKLYKLLFVGEVIGFQWAKSATKRSLILQCADLSNYWDYAYQWTNTGIFGPGIKAIFSGGSTNLFTDFLSSKGGVLSGIVRSGKCNSFPNLKGLAAGIIRLIEAIGGTYTARPGSGSRRYGGQNLFFSIAELRLRITQMVAAYEDDPTAQRLVGRGGGGLFDRLLGGQGGQTSIRQAINALSKTMFHEMYGQPCPLYIPGRGNEVSGVKRSRVKGHPTWGFITDRADRLIEGLEQVSASIADLAGQEQQLRSIGINTRSTRAVLARRLQAMQKTARQTSIEIRRKSTQTSRPPEVADTIYKQSAQLIGQANQKLRFWRPKAPDKTRDAVVSKLEEAVEQLRRASVLTFIESRSSDIVPARLVQQIFRPDIWFGAPPMCNVLFPDQYVQMSYTRMFLQEPTRFLLKTHDEFFGPDALFDKFYYAPQAGYVQSDQAKVKRSLGRELLDHELFTGILPVFEKMGETSLRISREKVPEVEGVPKVSLAQRSTNFMYFKHRFNSRQMQVQAKFNPWIACGFPGLIIDKYVDAATLALHNELRQKVSDKNPELELAQLKINELLGTNFLGNFTQVAHSVSQVDAAGSTSINCSYPRQPEESTAFWGAFDNVQVVRKREGEEATRSTDIAAINSPKPYSLGPNNGRITAVQDVTNLYRAGARSLESAGTAGESLPLFDIDSNRQLRRQVPGEVPVGIAVTAVDLPWIKDLENFTGGPDVQVVFRAYRITESIPRYRREEVLLPAEELIRPGWYGDIWSPAKIGKAYREFFRIGAITDAQTILGPDAAIDAAEATEAQENALADQQEAEDAEDPRAFAPGVLALEEGASIQQAVEFLQLTYSYIRQQGLDVDEFIRAYTWRPVATMIDILGTSDLEFDNEGFAALSGVEGFHSRAFGPYDDLFGLVAPEIEDIVGVKRGSQAAQVADTRKRKYERVQAYISALQFSRAILG